MTRYGAYAIGAGLTMAAAAWIVLSPAGERFVSPGPLLPGHEALACVGCHVRALGTARQQIQANVRYLFGRRTSPADFIHPPVDNARCQSCHPALGDVHPAYRFNEPRFAGVRAILAVQQCVACHREHNGRRVSIDTTFCQYCHQSVTLRKGSIEPSHEALIREKQWGSCLRCHDYHGRHSRPDPRVLPTRITEQTVLDYFSTGVSPYGPARTAQSAVKKEIAQ